MKSIVSGTAIVTAALLSGFMLFPAKPSLAETPLSQFQEQQTQSTQNQDRHQDPAAGSVDDALNCSLPATLGGKGKEGREKAASPVTASARYVATAYSLRGRTASGRLVSQGLIAADPRMLPLGSRVRLEAGAWSGEYLVADTGGAIRGRKIDIWTPTTREALRFGRRTVKLTVLSYPPKRSAPKKRGQS